MASTATDPGYGVAPPGFRLPSATRLGAVRLQVADLARSLDWYGKVLGLEPLERAGNRVALAAPGAARTLVELHERRGATPVPRRGRLGLYHYALLLPDRPALGRFLGHLAEINERAGMSDHLVSEAIYLSDPDGLGIEVYADRPRASWRHQDRQLVMATDPLDVQSVLAAGGGEPWTGMPAGTVLGHVHLYVDDIDRAARFYHEGLGLDRMVWSYPGALFLSAGGYHHHLGTNTWAAGAPLAGENDARLLEWDIVLPDAGDVAAAAGSLERIGVSVHSENGSAAAADPWGTRLRLRAA
ncbi:MAG TPA: VOC family protein [Gemmatimonadales bacterium]|nr:VOC family protein [Gemmatimonadales bacterium]